MNGENDDERRNDAIIAVEATQGPLNADNDDNLVFFMSFIIMILGVLYVVVFSKIEDASKLKKCQSVIDYFAMECNNAMLCY